MFLSFLRFLVKENEARSKRQRKKVEKVSLETYNRDNPQKDKLLNNISADLETKMIQI